jgi:hypothetical protein
MLSLDKKRVNLLKKVQIGICFLLTNDKTASKEDQNPKELKLKMCARVCAKQKGEHSVPLKLLI